MRSLTRRLPALLALTLLLPATGRAAGPFDGTYAYAAPGFTGSLMVSSTINGTVYYDLRSASLYGGGTCGVTGMGVIEGNKLTTQLPGQAPVQQFPGQQPFPGQVPGQPLPGAGLLINFFFQGTATVEAAGVPALCSPGGQLAGTYTKASGDIRLTRDQVRTIQARLAQLGFDPGPIDGLAGPRTRRALAQYQSARGLVPDGAPTVEMIVRLNQNF